MSTFAPVDINTTVSNFFQNGTPITIETKDLLLRPSKKVIWASCRICTLTQLQ